VNKHPEVVRQGDILIILNDPAAEAGDEIPRDNGRVVLAYGEATGHAHALDERHVTLYTHKKSADRVLKVVGNVAYLKHDEHFKIQIPSGTHTVRRQREWTDQDEPRVVAD
jgi:hypothetical protein